MRYATGLFAVLICSCSFAGDAKPPAVDVIDAELTKACDEYQFAVEVAADKMSVAMDELKQKIQRNERLKDGEKNRLLTQVEVEREQFKMNFLQPPTSDNLRGATVAYKRTVALASEKCLEAFDRAANQYAKVNEPVRVKEVREDRRRFVTGEQRTPLFANTAWTGTLITLFSDAPVTEVRAEARLENTERQPGRFKGNFEWGDRIVEVEGTVSVREIRWAATDAKAIKGDAGFDFTGQFYGEFLSLRYKKHHEDGRVESGAVNLRRGPLLNKK